MTKRKRYIKLPLRALLILFQPRNGSELGSNCHVGLKENGTLHGVVKAELYCHLLTFENEHLKFKDYQK
jgi:hypothetical protein